MSKNILIAGASGDIGFFLAQQWQKKGYTVHGFGRRKTTFQKADFQYTSLDISDQESVKNYISKIRKEKIKIDIFINCIGHEESIQIGFLSKEKIESGFGQNLIPMLLFSKEITHLMMMEKHGLLINLSSIIAGLANSGSVLYGMTKVSTEYFFRVIDREYSKMGIRACSVRLPIVLETKMASNLKANTRDFIKQESKNAQTEVALSDVYKFVEDIVFERKQIPENQIFEWQ
jgi:3-oxoacyl-[acyl-carrier protein] reductase